MIRYTINQLDKHIDEQDEVIIEKTKIITTTSENL
jgi:hypothetical protein